MWIVKYSNYFPRETESFHKTKESAEKRAEELNEEYDACMWEIEEI